MRLPAGRTPPDTLKPHASTLRSLSCANASITITVGQSSPTPILDRQFVYSDRVDEPLMMLVDVDKDGSTTGTGDWVYYYKSNHRGDVVAVVGNELDGNGASFEFVDYTAFGLFVVSSLGSVVAQNVDESNQDLSVPSGNPFLFTGRRLDSESGFYYYRARYYEPHDARFLSQDPVGVWGDSWNWGNSYAYVGNSPVVFTDPTGRVANFVVQCAVGAAIDGGFSILEHRKSLFGRTASIRSWGAVIVDAGIGCGTGILGGPIAKLARKALVPAITAAKSADMLDRWKPGLIKLVGGAGLGAANDAASQTNRVAWGTQCAFSIRQNAFAGSGGALAELRAARKLVDDGHRAQAIRNSGMPLSYLDDVALDARSSADSSSVRSAIDVGARLSAYQLPEGGFYRGC